MYASLCVFFFFLCVVSKDVMGVLAQNYVIIIYI